ncbi:MAG TPA: hypothetical protein DCR65_01060 [Gammaproteobacteria bacterium]|jgi:hypothetical protein|nr:hypothetical protein [Gammaproteobacteria bacterium]
MRLIRRPLPRTLTASAASVSIALVLASGPACAQTALPSKSQTVSSGTFSTDGTGVQRISWLQGGYSLISAGAFNEGQSGADLTLDVSGGTFTVSIGTPTNSVDIPTLSNGGPGTPWASALLAASRGSDREYYSFESNVGDAVIDGGYGGAVNLTVSPADAAQPVESE